MEENNQNITEGEVITYGEPSVAGEESKAGAEVGSDAEPDADGDGKTGEGLKADGKMVSDVEPDADGDGKTEEGLKADGATTPKRTEYTGEYGNAVEASEEERSSVYSYSYRDHPQEATRSGDYYADRDTALRDTAEGEKENAMAASNSSEDTSDREDAGNTTASAGWQGASDGQQRSGSGMPNGVPEASGDQNAGERKAGLTWKKVGAVALAAAIFGVVAAACFQGVCYFSSHVLGINVAALDTPVGYTTDVVNYTQTVSAQAVGTTDVSAIVSQTMPSIVAITSTQEGQNYYDLFGQYIPGQESTSCGSGFVVGKNDKELLVATNNHVIDGAKTISVQFCDEEVYEAKTKGTDASNDLAVIAVKLTDIKSETMHAIRIASLGDSSEARVGEMVVAIGNALGYGQSVTVGYISAKDRQIQASAEDGSGQNNLTVIQTDAAINPGNSGGALLNLRGEVIGINSAKISNSAVEGVGYAIPISEATPIIDELMNKEVLTEEQKGYLGISGRTVSQEALSFHMPEGVYVEEVAKEGAAGKAGIQKGDVITAINDIKVTTIESLKEKANSYKKGTTVTITLQRNTNGEYEEKKLDVTLQGKDSLESIPSSTPSSRYNDDENGDSNDRDDGGSGWDDFFPFGFGY